MGIVYFIVIFNTLSFVVKNLHRLKKIFNVSYRLSFFVAETRYIMIRFSDVAYVCRQFSLCALKKSLWSERGSLFNVSIVLNWTFTLCPFYVNKISAIINMDKK